MAVNFTTLGMLVGGLGLFLLAVGMITEGLKLAAGRALRGMLARSTRTRAKGIATGISFTALVQSSSAVTVATIGFVNAGLLTLNQAMGVVYGANIGTTITGWLVAIIGFQIKVEAFALPMIGLGMMLRLARGTSRWGSLGTAMAGFGLFFIGIDVLKNAFEGMAAGIDIEKLSIDGFAGVLLYLGTGFLMTLLTQSSSAAIAITLTAASGGVLSLEAAAAMVIGANVGTTSTAGFAVIGATANAKRVASAHVLFNLLTGLVALIILPVLFVVIKYAGQVLGLEDNPAITLALFHTLFNVLGVLLMWPLTDRVSLFLLQRFRTAEEIQSTPRYLDNTVVASPPLALNAMYLELQHLAELTRQLTMTALHTTEQIDPGLQSSFSAVNNLGRAVSAFSVQVSNNPLPAEIAEQLPRVLYALQCYTTTADLAFHYARYENNLQPFSDAQLAGHMLEFRQQAEEIIELSGLENQPLLDDKQLEYHNHYRQLRSDLLTAASQGRFDIEMTGLLLDQIYRLDRIAKQITRGSRLLDELKHLTQVSPKPQDVQEESAELSETTY
jgi:phosphate:Na+ symporter